MVFRRCTVSGIEYSHDANGESGDRAPIWAGPESYQSYMPVCLCVHVYTHTHSASGIDDFGGRIKQKGRQSNSGPAFTEKPSPQCWWHPPPCTVWCGGHLLKHSFPARQAEPRRKTLRNSHQRCLVSLTPRSKEVFPLPPIDCLVISWKCSAGYWAVYTVFFPMKYTVPERIVTSLWNLCTQFFLLPAFSSLVASLHPLWMHRGVICFLCRGGTAARHPSESGENPHGHRSVSGAIMRPREGAPALQAGLPFIPGMASQNIKQTLPQKQKQIHNRGTTWRHRKLFFRGIWWERSVGSMRFLWLL